MSIKMELTGDWALVNSLFQNLTEVYPTFEAQLMEDGELVLEKIRGHIDAQDLGWTPLSEHTIELKGGDDTIYIETGELKNGLTVQKVSSSKGLTIYVGAPSTTHSGGMSMEDLLIWLEYGTDKIPPRPLIEPTMEEVQDLLEKSWESLMLEFTRV